MPRYDSLLDRIKSKIVVEDTCHLWCGVCNTAGYAILNVTVAPGRKKSVLVHRVLWELTCDEPLDSLMDLRHLPICPHLHCVNLAHHHLVTRQKRGPNTRKAPRQAYQTQHTAEKYLGWKAPT